jgi:hypothetical protein
LIRQGAAIPSDEAAIIVIISERFRGYKMVNNQIKCDRDKGKRGERKAHAKSGKAGVKSNHNRRQTHGTREL